MPDQHITHFLIEKGLIGNGVMGPLLNRWPFPGVLLALAANPLASVGHRAGLRNFVTIGAEFFRRVAHAVILPSRSGKNVTAPPIKTTMPCGSMIDGGFCRNIDLRD